MSMFFKIAAFVICATIIALTLRKTSADFAMLVTIAGCCFAGFFIVMLAQPVVDFSRELFDAGGISNAYISPLLKTVGVGLLTQIASAICTDAGESALAKMAELGGCVLSICVAIPLMNALLEFVKSMTGG